MSKKAKFGRLHFTDLMHDTTNKVYIASYILHGNMTYKTCTIREFTKELEEYSADEVKSIKKNVIFTVL